MVHSGLTVIDQVNLRCKFLFQLLDLDIRMLQVLLCLFGSVGSYIDPFVGFLHLFIVSFFGLVHHYGVHL
jgi:hypothetical protein